MALRPSGPPPTSPRSNLSRLLSVTLGAEATQSQPELQSQMDVLMEADAENKLRNRKLYLILDLDETLVYSQRMKPGAVPVGHQIMVHNQPFDMVLRPGLEHFLKVLQKTFVVFMYTMGDEAYTHAVLDVIDPQRDYFRGATPPPLRPLRTVPLLMPRLPTRVSQEASAPGETRRAERSNTLAVRPATRTCPSSSTTRSTSGGTPCPTCS
jgi:hypothetical protein